MGDWRLCQLGVNSDLISAIPNGALASRQLFFGGNTPEIVSIVDFNSGSWNGDFSLTAYSTRPWMRYGGQSFNESSTGLFAFSRQAGDPNSAQSHRTILLGY